LPAVAKVGIVVAVRERPFHRRPHSGKREGQFILRQLRRNEILYLFFTYLVTSS
jgi:hypothetical protein